MQSLATDELNHRPTELEQAVDLITKTADRKESGVVVQISIRMPAFAHCTARAMAQHSGLPIGTVINTLVRVGIDAMAEALPVVDAQKIEELRNEAISDLIHGNKFDKGAK